MFIFGVAKVRLGDIATIERGGNFQKKDFTNNGIPCIHYGQIYTKFGTYVNKTLTSISEEKAKKQKIAHTNDLIMAITSENIDDVCKTIVWEGEDDIAVSGHTAIIRSSINPRYLALYLQTSDFFVQKRKIARGTKVIEVSPEQLANIIIPIPSIERQEKLVELLSEFEALCNNLKSGLPAEIKARHKQYEYYRDKLLTFPQKD